MADNGFALERTRLLLYTYSMHGYSFSLCKNSFHRVVLVSFFGILVHVPVVFADDIPSPSIRSLFPTTQNISFIIGDQTETISGQEINKWLTVDTRTGIDMNHRSEIENTDLCPLQQFLCDILLSQKTREFIANQSVLTFDKEAVRNAIETLNTKVAKDPVDAKFSITDNKISAFSLSQDGSRIDMEKSVPLVIETLAHTDQNNITLSITLPLIVIKPAVTASEADTFGITELIGEGHTNFAGSPKNRIHNITRALEQFNGIMIAPGEEFSFVKLLGDVDGEHGYLPELVIKANKTEPEFGGGICQVSSTVFRAAIYSGLKITARRNHAYPVSYYKPYGMDATIYIPKPDLRFVNTTPGHILMETAIEGTQLFFRFYGTSDGRTIEVDGPHVLEHHPDGSMKTVFTQKVTDASGAIIINDDFHSNYASPSKFPHPGQEPVFTQKPADWSRDQWSVYKKAHNL